MRRRFTNIPRTLALLLCIFAMGLWVQSYLRCYDIEWSQGSVVSSRGILFYQFTFLSGSNPQKGLRFHSPNAFYEPWGFNGANYLYLHFAGITFARGGRHVQQISVPLWVIVLLSGSVSLSLKLLSARHRLTKDKSCDSCGYNLTGNVSGVCPECGKRIEQGVYY